MIPEWINNLMTENRLRCGMERDEHKRVIEDYVPIRIEYGKAFIGDVEFRNQFPEKAKLRYKTNNLRN